MLKPHIGWDKSGGLNLDKPEKRTTPSGKHNLANTDKYKLGDYSSDRRFKTTAARRTPRGGTMQIPLGGFGGARGTSFAEQDFEYQKELDKMIWERSTPDVTGVGGTVRWDRDKNMITSALSPENQAIYDAMIERQKSFGGQADSLSGGGWQDAQQQIFDQQRGLYAEGDARTLDQLREREVAMGRGAESTAGYWERRARQDAMNQRDLEIQNNAFAQSQQLIDSNLGRQYGAVGMMGGLGNIANSMKVMPQPNTTANMLGVSDASTAWRDLQALEAAKRSKGKSDAWGSILGSLFG
jgi:hypothetical protein